MHASLAGKHFLVKEHAHVFKAAHNFDIFDVESGEQLFCCREEQLGFFTKLFRFSKYKKYTPFNIQLSTPDGAPMATIERGMSFLASLVSVKDADGQLVGQFRQPMLSFKPRFDVLSPEGQVLCQLVGKWTSWDFRFMHGDLQLGHVAKKWAGLSQELFTSADNYVVEIADEVPDDNPLRLLIVAASVCIDMVLHE